MPMGLLLTQQANGSPFHYGLFSGPVMVIHQIIALLEKNLFPTAVQHVACLPLLGLQVEPIVLVRWYHYRDYAGNPDSMSLQVLYLLRVVCQESNRFHM